MKSALEKMIEYKQMFTLCNESFKVHFVIDDEHKTVYLCRNKYLNKDNHLPRTSYRF